jgi:hypothetical protein
MMAARARANGSERHAAATLPIQPRPSPSQSRRQMRCCGHRRSPPLRSLRTAQASFAAALLCLLCLLVICCHEVVDCQSSPLEPALRRRRGQGPNSVSTTHELSSSTLSLHDGVLSSSRYEDLAVNADIPKRGELFASSPPAGRRRDLVPAIRYTNSTLSRSDALTIYRTFCPAFRWKKGGCTFKSGKGGGGSSEEAVSSLRWSQCGREHVLRRFDIIMGQWQTTFRYTASRNGVPYGRRLVIVCPHSTRMYVVSSLSFLSTDARCLSCACVCVCVPRLVDLDSPCPRLE